MRIIVSAIGRMKSGPERELCDRYVDRADKAGRTLGFGAVSVREFAESRASSVNARKDEEAASLLGDMPAGALLIALDERGATPSSDEFARLLENARDRGVAALQIAIGGPDGHGPALLGASAHRISFGRLTLPHQIVRILAAEQIYRAMTILSGHPYHRA